MLRERTTPSSTLFEGTTENDFDLYYHANSSGRIHLLHSNGADAWLSLENEEMLIAAIRDACAQVREMKEGENGNR